MPSPGVDTVLVFFCWALSLVEGQNPSNQSQVCGKHYNSPVFHLVPPKQFPEERCEYLVDPSSPSVCQLELDLRSAALPACPSDHMTVDGRAICGVHSDVILLPFQHPRSTISFRMNRIGGDDFNITVRQRECRSGLTRSWCSGDFSGENVLITSPGYPVGYPEDVDCRYTIRASARTICQVEVRFEDSALENSANCTKDRLQINGDTLCGELLGVRNYYIDDKLDLRFTTDAEGSGKGFKLVARQIHCPDITDSVVIEAPVDNDKVDNIIDCTPSTGGFSPNLQEGYPIVQRPWPPFRLPEGWNGQFPSPGYLPPPSSLGNRVPLQNEPPNDVYHNSVSNSYGTPYQSGLPQVSTLRPPQRLPLFSYQPKLNKEVPLVQSAPSLNNVPDYYNRLFNPALVLRPIAPSGVPTYEQQNQACCGHSYTDSHFLIVSPGFPRSRSSDCIYSIQRYSPLTYQLRLQFRYFWTGVDTGSGCSGGYLEIDGTRVCGCKTGLFWTLPFSDEEITKTLHLRLDSSNDRLFNGFVIEVYQDDSYNQRYKRADYKNDGTFTEYPKTGRVGNFSQYVENVVERYPVILRNDDLLLQTNGSPEKLIWDSSRQSWVLPTDLLCLQWNLQDWYLLAREALWAQYYCPVSTTSSAVREMDSYRNDVTQSTACQTCRYFCRQNCRCC